MDALMISKIANDIINETILLNLKFYVLVVFITFIVTCISSYLFTYTSARGKALATKADFNLLLTQLQITTATTETIKRSITHSDWALKELKLLRRQKLEELLIALFEVEEWVDRFRINVLFREQNDNSTSPICKVRLIGNLYFNQLKNELSAFNAAHSNLNICILKGNAKLQSIRILKVEAENKIKTHVLLQDKQEHEALLKEFYDLINQQKNILQFTTDEFLNNFRELLNATRAIEVKASLLMNEITGVDFENDLLS